MIEGVIHHCTEMEVDRQYVDSHGQSTVAFAFCRLLGFELLPRLRRFTPRSCIAPTPVAPKITRDFSGFSPDRSTGNWCASSTIRW